LNTLVHLRPFVYLMEKDRVAAPPTMAIL